MRRDILPTLVAATSMCCTALSVGGAHPIDYARLGINGAIVRQVADTVGSIVVGDVLQVSVFETDGGVDPGNFVTLPSQTVDCKGTILVPHAGRIPVAGRTLQEIQREIEARLAIRAIAPRVVVTLLEPRSVLSECASLQQKRPSMEELLNG